ncbi:putative penicillin-binding protein PbpX [Pseudoalteromonas sp. P1-9]|uniref:serine hydrolase domain-containing protein n=1 Tax=Pseudoalteromonas sp. P1-9 TaxID=1710354 RepID=UPI0006D5DC3B|nr:serine hydrolase domain-containing protein [Pseudoalteromonas sp. P1-9]KPV93787.1 putative penicillin-binding protein PbpX [Pseudoalteromonas sp. P1-9]
MRLIYLISLIFLSCSSHSTSQSIPEKIDSLITQYNQLEQFNGVVLVAKNGQPILKKGYGKANFEWDVDHLVTGRFRISSVTKQFTAMLILQLVEQRKINLNDKIIDHIPEYRADTGKKITIHQLLTHTSGLGNFFHLQDFKRIEARNPYSVREFIKTLCSEDLLFEPGTQFKYSNAGYTILGHIIERVTKKTFEQILVEKIFNPIGMLNSGFNGQSRFITHRVNGYERTLAGVKPAPFIDMSVPYSAGSIYSSVDDLLLWDRALANNTLLSPKLTNVMYTVSPHYNYAAGWLVSQLDSAKYGQPLTKLYHGGGIQGFNAHIARIPEDNVLIVLLNNTGGAPMTAITDNIINTMYGKPINPVQLRKNQALYKRLKEDGLEYAVTWYQQQVSQNNGLNERRLNQFGYELLEVNEFDAAIAFFKLNVEAHPQSENVYDSLADAYIATSQYENALIQFTKAQQLASSKSKYATKINEIKNKL